MSRTAVLLIDLQKEVLDPAGTLSGDLLASGPALLDAIRSLVAWARAHELPVIWIRMAYRAGYVDASRRVRQTVGEMKGRMIDGTWGAEIVDGVGKLASDIVIVKKRPSAFFGTDLHFVLRGLGVDRLVVAGTSTNWAVESTARDAESLDYEVVVPREATAARMAEMHEPSLRSMATRYAKVTSLRELIGNEP